MGSSRPTSSALPQTLLLLAGVVRWWKTQRLQAGFLLPANGHFVIGPTGIRLDHVAMKGRREDGGKAHREGIEPATQVIYGLH